MAGDQRDDRTHHSPEWDAALARALDAAPPLTEAQKTTIAAAFRRATDADTAA